MTLEVGTAGGWAEPTFSIGVDIGGTFTDGVIVASAREPVAGKVLTTAHDPAQGFFGAIEAAARQLGEDVRVVFSRATRIAHGTTTGINAVVTRSGARVGLLATRGHGDAIRIMDNSARFTGATIEELLDYTKSVMAAPFVAADDIREISERLDWEGDVVLPLSEVEVLRAVEDLLETGVEAIAVAYLWSHVNPVHERRTLKLIQKRWPELFVSISSDVAPRIDEYPRTATTVLNSYIGPLMAEYVHRIEAGARERGYQGQVFFATSSGGLVDGQTVARLPILTAQSGPASGVIACSLAGRERAESNILAADMGGTSLDVSVIEDGQVLLRDESVIERNQLHLRQVDIDSIGAGGGSIAWLDETSGTIRVGPRSAGSTPGPVCYGRGGTEVTVTDANLILGFLNPQRGLAGDIALSYRAAELAMEELGGPLGLDAGATAAGIIEIVDSHMEDLIRRVTLQKGHDPRDFFLWAYGGAAGMHAGRYAQELGISRIVIPMANLASTWSAYGVAVSDLTRSFEHPCYWNSPIDLGKFSSAYEGLESQARAFLAPFLDHNDDPVLSLNLSAEVKYPLQFYSVEVSVPVGAFTAETMESLVADFEVAYERRYGPGSGYKEGGITVTGLRLTASVPWSSAQSSLERHVGVSDRTKDEGVRSVYWRESRTYLDTPIIDGATLGTGSTHEGPAVIEYPATTVIVRPNQVATVNALGDLVLEVGGR